MNSAKKLSTTPQFFLSLLLVFGSLANVESWSSSPKSSSQNTDKTPSTRRQLFQQSAAVLTGAVVTVVPSIANAACLQGDVRPLCIGIYKVPLDDNILPYVSTPEELHKFAPDLKYVPPIEYPESFEVAMDILRAQRASADEIRQIILAGKLEEAGIKVLGLIPQVTSSSRRVFADLEAKIRTNGLVANKAKALVPTESETTVEEMAIEMAEDQMNYVNGYWGDCDITIGQGIRGELGKMTVTQLAILEALRDATCALDDYLVTAVTLSGGGSRLAA